MLKERIRLAAQALDRRFNLEAFGFDAICAQKTGAWLAGVFAGVRKIGIFQYKVSFNTYRNTCLKQVESTLWT